MPFWRKYSRAPLIMSRPLGGGGDDCSQEGQQYLHRGGREGGRANGRKHLARWYAIARQVVEICHHVVDIARQVVEICHHVVDLSRPLG